MAGRGSTERRCGFVRRDPINKRHPKFFAEEDPSVRRWSGARVTDGGLAIVAVTRDVKSGGPRTSRNAVPSHLQMPDRRTGFWRQSLRRADRGESRGAGTGARRLIRQRSAAAIESIEIGTDLVGHARQERMVAILLVAFGMLAVGLACLGLYDLIAYHVVRRERVGAPDGACSSHVLWGPSPEVSGRRRSRAQDPARGRLSRCAGCFRGTRRTSASDRRGGVMSVRDPRGAVRHDSRVDPLIALRTE